MIADEYQHYEGRESPHVHNIYGKAKCFYERSCLFSLLFCIFCTGLYMVDFV